MIDTSILLLHAFHMPHIFGFLPIIAGALAGWGVGAAVTGTAALTVAATGALSGAGLDVYEKEPLPENNKLRFLPNALLTPHIGYVTAENYNIFYNQMIEGLEACVDGKPVRVLE